MICTCWLDDLWMGVGIVILAVIAIFYYFWLELLLIGILLLIVIYHMNRVWKKKEQRLATERNEAELCRFMAKESVLAKISIPVVSARADWFLKESKLTKTDPHLSFLWEEATQTMSVDNEDDLQIVAIPSEYAHFLREIVHEHKEYYTISGYYEEGGKRRLPSVDFVIMRTIEGVLAE